MRGAEVRRTMAMVGRRIFLSRAALLMEGSFGSVSSEDFCGKGDSIMYCGKYHSDSVYLVIYQADFQSAEKDKDFQRIDHKIGRPCDEKK